MHSPDFIHHLALEQQQAWLKDAHHRHLLHRAHPARGLRAALAARLVALAAWLEPSPDPRTLPGLRSQSTPDLPLCPPSAR